MHFSHFCTGASDFIEHVESCRQQSTMSCEVSGLPQEAFGTMTRQDMPDFMH